VKPRNLLVTAVLFSSFVFSDIPPRPLDAVDQPKTVEELNYLGVNAANEGQFQESVAYLQEALTLYPDEIKVTQNLSAILTTWAAELYKNGKMEEAISRLRKAATYDETNGPSLFFLGDLVYLIENDFKGAIELWNKAKKDAPADKRRMIIERIKRAELDYKIERSYHTEESRFFEIHFENEDVRGKIKSLSAFLDEQYQVFSEALSMTPGKVSVIVYPRGTFARLVRHRDFAIGFYDGRIRLREEELGTDEEANTAAHELAHAFLHRGFGPHIPSWIHEGYAQFSEPSLVLSNREADVKKSIEARTLWIPLKWIDRHFSQPSSDDDLIQAYLQSYVVVNFLIGDQRQDEFQAFLSKLGSGSPAREAFDESFEPLRWSRIQQGIFDS
jgi:tetratricopeptide (TPR) repeat protein